ncbi:response regulator [Myxococcota bacterium]
MCGTPDTSLPSLLVVDDEPDTVDTVMRMVRGHYRCVGATSIAQAVEVIDREQFDLVIADQRLPDGTGTSFLARVAEQSPLTRRIILSAYADTHDLLAAINIAKVSHFLMKPVLRDQLLATLEKAVEDYQREREAMEHLLLTRFGGPDATQGRIRPRTSNQKRQRPTGWPESGTIRTVGAANEQPLAELLSPNLEVAVALLSPGPGAKEKEDSLRAWSAELERRLITSLRETDQAFRMGPTAFVVAFSHTSRDGAGAACKRITEDLNVKVRIEAWPSEFGDPLAFTRAFVGKATRL